MFVFTIFKFGNNTYPRRIRRRSNLGHFFGEKSASYGPKNTVYVYILSEGGLFRPKHVVRIHQIINDKILLVVIDEFFSLSSLL